VNVALHHLRLRAKRGRKMVRGLEGRIARLEADAGRARGRLVIVDVDEAGNVRYTVDGVPCDAYAARPDDLVVRFTGNVDVDTL